MKGSMKLFTIFGIDIKLHFSWWFVFFLLSWILSDSFFPAYFPEQSSMTYWMMGITATLLLFVSVLLHELSHSLVAKARKIRVESITLFFFGGVAGINKEEMKPSSEFLMAIAGPLFSLFLAGGFFLIYSFNGNVFWTAITFYLYQLNFILAVFNLVPAFPLDGGRALRAILYWRFKDLKKATYIAVKGGKFFAGVMIVFGIYGLFSGIGGGLWFIFLGGFLYFIAGASYEQVVIKEVLEKIPVKLVLNKKIPQIKPGMKFKELVKNYSSTEQDIFFVKSAKFSGLLDVKSIQQISPKMQQMMTVKQLAQPLEKMRTVNINSNAYTAFKKLTKEKSEVLPVMNNGKLVGFVTHKIIMHRLIWGLRYGRVVRKVKKINKKRR
ncbi:MAG: site-2 protease family protein [Nanoarchaeota archaeon]|nr:site-2 protease family protein [Nanoarchaeota archaeon]